MYKAFSKTDSSIYALKKLIIYHEKENKQGKEYEKDGVYLKNLIKLQLLLVSYYCFTRNKVSTKISAPQYNKTSSNCDIKLYILSL